jgi:hypothetical protein
MHNTFRTLILAGIAVCSAAVAPTARADVIRIAVVVAESKADYDNNAALVPTFAALLKKGAKAVYAGTDAAKMSITTTSVWSNEAAIAAVVGGDDWKAAAAKLKGKPYTAEVFEIVP